MSDAAPAARVTPSVSEFTAVVLDSVVNTPHTKTLRLDLGAPAGYRAGQYVTIDPHQFAWYRRNQNTLSSSLNIASIMSNTVSMIAGRR